MPSSQSALDLQHPGTFALTHRLIDVSHVVVKHTVGVVAQSAVVLQHRSIAVLVHVPPAHSSNVHTSPSSQSAFVVQVPP